MFKNFLKCMGVINITPNSFYGPSQHHTSLEVLKKLIEWKEHCDIFDFGAQSTAPQSKSIDAEEEVFRFAEIALPALENYFLAFGTLPQLSLDTFRPKTFSVVSAQIRKIKADAKIYWNDVSGILDPAVFDILQAHPANYYIFCHNRVPDRESTSRHRDFTPDFRGKNHQEYIEFFSQAWHQLKEKHLDSRVVFDINFGFAKSREENHYLLGQFTEITKHFAHQNWMIGLSQKSFLKMMESEDDFQLREHLHFYFLSMIRKESPTLNLIVRAHNPQLVRLVNYTFSQNI